MQGQSSPERVGVTLLIRELQQRKWHSKAPTTAEPDSHVARATENERERGSRRGGNSGSAIASLCLEFRYKFSSEITLFPVAQRAISARSKTIDRVAIGLYVCMNTLISKTIGVRTVKFCDYISLSTTQLKFSRELGYALLGTT